MKWGESVSEFQIVFTKHDDENCQLKKIFYVNVRTFLTALFGQGQMMGLILGK